MFVVLYPLVIFLIPACVELYIYSKKVLTDTKNKLFFSDQHSKPKWIQPMKFVNSLYLNPRKHNLKLKKLLGMLFWPKITPLGFNVILKDGKGISNGKQD